MNFTTSRTARAVPHVMKSAAVTLVGLLAVIMFIGAMVSTPSLTTTMEPETANVLAIGSAVVVAGAIIIRMAACSRMAASHGRTRGGRHGNYHPPGPHGHGCPPSADYTGSSGLLSHLRRPLTLTWATRSSMSPNGDLHKSRRPQLQTSPTMGHLQATTHHSTAQSPRPSLWRHRYASAAVLIAGTALIAT